MWKGEICLVSKYKFNYINNLIALYDNKNLDCFTQFMKNIHNWYNARKSEKSIIDENFLYKSQRAWYELQKNK